MTSTETRTVVTVEDARDVDLPPIPDRAAVDAWHQRHAEIGDAAGKPPADIHAGHYQHLLLNTRTGALRFGALDWRNPQRDKPGQLISRSTWEHPVSGQLLWIIDSGVDELPYLDAEQGNALARQVAPLAQVLLDNLTPVPDTNELDWSPESASAALDISRACERTPHEPLGRRLDIIDIREAVRAAPAISDSAWASKAADAGDEELDRMVSHATRAGLDWWPELANVFDLGMDVRHTTIVGARAWLHGRRRDANQGYDVMDARRWFETRPLAGLDADTTNEGVQQAYQRNQDAARLMNVQLAGLYELLYERRADMRRQVLDDLDATGAKVEHLEEQLRAARRTRQVLLTRVIGWNRPGDTDPKLAEYAHMSKQAVSQLRKQLDGTDDTDGEGDDL